jgi:hypothetical protein
VIGPGHGWFPFGFLLFPLLFFGLFFLFRAAFWGRRWGGPGGPHGPWGRGGAFDEWHRRQHDEGGAAGTGDEPPRA